MIIKCSVKEIQELLNNKKETSVARTTDENKIGLIFNSNQIAQEKHNSSDSKFQDTTQHTF